MKNNDYTGEEKRQHLRIEYPPHFSPKFNIQTQEFEVKNISEGGLRFISDKKITLQGWISGMLEFKTGNSQEIEGIVVRKKGNHIGLKFITPLPESVIRKEQEMVELAVKSEVKDV